MMTISLNGSVLKGTSLGSTALDPMLTAAVPGIVQLLADTQQFVSQIADQSLSLGRISVVQFLRLTPDQDITVKINGSSVGIPVSGGGDLILARTQVSAVDVNNQSGNICNLVVVAGGGPYVPG